MSNMELMEAAAAKIMTMYGLGREKTEKEENTVDAVEAVKNRLRAAARPPFSIITYKEATAKRN